MPTRTFIALIASFILGVGFSGCHTLELESEYYGIADSNIPRELNKVSFPTYRVEPPDILLIESGIITRGEHDRLKRGESLVVKVENGVPLEVDPDVPPLQAQAEMPLQIEFRVINGPFVINPDGTIDLGPVYGKVQVADLTLEEARAAVIDHLESGEEKGGVGLLNPRVAVTLAAVEGKQPIAGEHLVRPDGTVSLGVHGEIYVAGQTLDEVRQQVEEILRSEGDRSPQVSVDVLAYNSKKYYVVMEGGGFGEEVVPLAWTGNETVLDAIAQVQGLSQVSSKRIWIARPAPAGTDCAQILDVHWRAITAEGITTTNYQIAPGDRVYVAADKMIVFDNALGKLIAPMQRVFGVILLGSGMASNLRFWTRRGSRIGTGSGTGTNF